MNIFIQKNYDRPINKPRSSNAAVTWISRYRGARSPVRHAATWIPRYRGAGPNRRCCKWHAALPGYRHRIPAM